MEKELIKSLHLAISNIDNGCPSCIKEFIIEANLKFYKYGIIYTFEGGKLDFSDIEPKAQILNEIEKYEELSKVDIDDMEDRMLFYNVKDFIHQEFYNDKDF